MKTKLKELRTAAGLTQQQLADRTHVSSRTIISIEKEQYSPSLMLAYRLALVFGVTVEELCIRALWLLLTGMLVYMVLIAELGGGDSRMMTPLADKFSRIVFFGGLGYVIGRICKNKQLLRSRQLLQQQMKTELDERNQYLHDKSGGIVADILLAILLFVTLTASMFDMAAFYTAFSVLAAAILLKAAAYWFYSRQDGERPL